MNLDLFPKYTKYNPSIPVYCVTPNLNGCIHRFFDTSPISPSGKFLAVFQLPREDRQPLPGETGDIFLINLETGETRNIATTRAWEPQLGANINWGASDEELFFNDINPDDWLPFAWKLNPISGKKEKMEGTVYHASPDGKWLISPDLRTLRITQAGYGINIPQNQIPINRGASTKDGFFLTDTKTGKKRLLVSTAELWDLLDGQHCVNRPDQIQVYAFHCKFNPQGTKLMLSLRWFETDEPDNLQLLPNLSSVRFAWFTMNVDGTGKCCAVGPQEWLKGGHHATWFPDGQHISMNLNIDEDALRLAQVSSDGSDLKKIINNVVGSGHPTLHPNGLNILTDTYVHESTSFGDGTVPIRWINRKTGREAAIVRINARQPCQDFVLRVDPHPTWDRSWRYVTFNGFVGGTRKVFLADLQSLL